MGGVDDIMGFLDVRIYIENTGEEPALFLFSFQVVDSFQPVGHILAGIGFMEVDDGAVMHDDFLACSFLVMGEDFLLEGDEVKGVCGFDMLANILVTFG